MQKIDKNKLYFLFSLIVFIFAVSTKVNIAIDSFEPNLAYAKGLNKKLSITTNQSFIEGIKENNLALDDIKENFKIIFNALPEKIYVYPTENYYYFKTFSNGGEIWGNMRLDSIDREKGLLSFAYFFVNPNRNEPYYSQSRSWHKNFGKDDGLIVTKISKLIYEVNYLGKNVTFFLNDIKQELPKNLKKRNEEVLAGRICDESGFQFFLIYNQKLKKFYYILDETIPMADMLKPYGKNIYVGQLSEFAFYAEPEMDRKVLFGVNGKNIQRNNYYDGPFDQLADNFVNPTSFQSMLEDAYPKLKGKVKGRGDFVNEKGERGSSRVSISPYYSYQRMPHLWSRVSYCQKRYSKQDELTVCIASSFYENKS